MYSFQFQLLVFFITTVLLGLVTSSSHSKPYFLQENPAASIEPDLELPKCAEPGNFTYPKDCSKYISCDVNLKMSIKSCPTCLQSNECPDGRIYYNRDTRLCDMLIADERCPPPPTTTTTSTTTSTQKPPTGEECDFPCSERGYCDCYDICRADNSSSTGGSWELNLKCPVNLYWNPDAQDSTAHGGSCDFFENLSPELQEQYRLDLNCTTPPIECYWRPDPKCDNYYFYLPPKQQSPSQEVRLKCPVSQVTGESLYWDQNALTCVKCAAGSVCRTCP